MELWIRVQKNKQLNQGLVKVEDLILEKDNANEWSIRQSCDTLAIYKTEKRALEVLDEIQSKIKSKQLIETKNTYGWSSDKLIECRTLVEANYVYQMPEE